jgi:hypothetical protein
LYQGTTLVGPKKKRKRLGFNRLRKNSILQKVRKRIAPECPRNDLWRFSDGLLSPDFRPFAFHSGFFRSLFSPCLSLPGPEFPRRLFIHTVTCLKHPGCLAAASIKP